MDKKQIKLLKTICKLEMFDATSSSNEEKEKLRFLAANKYIASRADPQLLGRRMYKITEFGKAELHRVKQSNIRQWLPILISNFLSLVAIAISIIALTK